LDGDSGMEGEGGKGLRSIGMFTSSTLLVI
jgi:hypothetical protein